MGAANVFAMLATHLELWVFLLVYLGMLMGRLPWLRLDRTGIALLGAIALVAAGRLSMAQAVQAVDLPTVSLLFALMVVSAQLRLGGFYAFCARRLAGLGLSPPLWLGVTIFLAGILSAVFSNDIICLTMAPVLINSCRPQQLNPLPFLLALAAAANIGSAATLIGNPQNMLIGQAFQLSFAGFFLRALPPTVIGLLLCWLVIVLQFHRRWRPPASTAPEHPPATFPAAPPFDRRQTAKGLAVTGLLCMVFLFTEIPRETAALAGAGVLLTSRRLHSREMLALVDWQLLVLFIGLFVVNQALAQAGYIRLTLETITAMDINPAAPGWLFTVTVFLSNAVSNVPAVMLLMPLATTPKAPLILALASTLAGNLILVGSIANIIVADAAHQAKIPFDYRRHAATGIPVTLLSLAAAALFLF